MKDGMTRRYKLVVFVPEANALALRQAMGNAGAGSIGNYSHCSFSSKGIGRFLPLAGASPAIGDVGIAEEVTEERLEVLCDDRNIKAVIAAMRGAHPYEEIAFDLIALVDEESL